VKEMGINNIVTKRVLLVLFILTLFGCDALAERKDIKKRYIGIFESNMNFMNPTDTLSVTIFFTHDSFVLVFMIKNDSDYRYPMYNGTWVLSAGEEVDSADLKFENGVVKKGVFEDSETSFYESFNFKYDDILFYQPMRTMRRRKNIGR
jgi:hypothetical protein